MLPRDLDTFGASSSACKISHESFRLPTRARFHQLDLWIPATRFLYTFRDCVLSSERATRSRGILFSKHAKRWRVCLLKRRKDLDAISANVVSCFTHCIFPTLSLAFMCSCCPTQCRISVAKWKYFVEHSVWFIVYQRRIYLEQGEYGFTEPLKEHLTSNNLPDAFTLYFRRWHLFSVIF